MIVVNVVVVAVLSVLVEVTVVVTATGVVHWQAVVATVVGADFEHS